MPPLKKTGLKEVSYENIGAILKVWWLFFQSVIGYSKTVWIVEFVGIWLHQLHFSAVILGTSFLFLIACLVELKKGSISLSLENSTVAFTVIIVACQVIYLISCSCSCCKYSSWWIGFSLVDLTWSTGFLISNPKFQHT